MLSLTRRVGERIDITVDGRTIEIKVHGIKGNQVNLGIEADKDIIIHRREISDRIKADEKKATTKDGR